SVTLSTGHLVICLILISSVFKQNLNINFRWRPEVIIVLLLMLSYIIVIIIFIFMPSIAAYSRILANQIETFRICLGIVLFISCYLTIRKSSH
ncbi:MAG: hypothetical protein LRY55_03880, partial [Leadbetterella sp.]|nr:hypothetical protein [Leadbetterella sp.]